MLIAPLENPPNAFAVAPHSLGIYRPVTIRIP